MRKLYPVLSVIVLSVLFAACVKDEVNEAPVVNAGKDTAYQLSGVSQDTIRLTGSATDADGQVVGQVWTQVSGPNSVQIHTPGALTTKVSGLTTGVYQFQLMATDDQGAVGVDMVQISTTPAPIVNLALQPENNPNEVFAYSYDPNTPQFGDTEIPIGTWTVGTVVHYRAYLKMNFNIPTTATIISAKLSLYSMPNPHGGNMVDAQYGSSNAFTISRVTSAWTGNTTTWNNQPGSTSSNQVTVANSTSSTQDALNIDVTQLVKDMHQHGNHGFAMKMINENPYNIRQYVSSRHSTAAKRPKLEIQYSN